MINFCKTRGSKLRKSERECLSPQGQQVILPIVLTGKDFLLKLNLLVTIITTVDRHKKNPKIRIAKNKTRKNRIVLIFKNILAASSSLKKINILRK